MSFDGYDESEFIMSDNGIGSLLGGRVWEIQVPKEERGSIKGAGKIKPYAIVNFGSPVAERPGGRSGRTIAASESQQPHLMSITIAIHASEVADLKKATRSVLRKLISLVPSSTGNASEISAQGGQTIVERDADGTPVRLVRVIYAQVTIGLNA